jgi:CheY-like chemotaxis protein
MDNGIGIADHDIEAIWEPFFQVGNEERNRARGVGLGLYLVRKSVRALEGHSVSVKSRIGVGTCFTLEMPKISVIGRFPTLVSDAGALPMSRIQGMHVVLVEDDQGAREALEAQLESWGVCYYSGATSDAVLPAVLTKERRIEAILADLRLPGRLDGIATIQHIRECLDYLVDAVVITGEVDRDVVSSRLPEICALIQKPFDSSELYRILESLRML